MGNWISKPCWNVLGTFSGKWGRNVRSQTTELDEALKAGLFWVLLSLQSPSLSEKKLYTHTYFKLITQHLTVGSLFKLEFFTQCALNHLLNLWAGVGGEVVTVLSLLQKSSEKIYLHVDCDLRRIRKEDEITKHVH